MKKTMVCVKILLSLIFLIVGNYATFNSDNISEEKAGDMFNCLCVICCDLGRVYEMERIFAVATPHIQEQSLKWYADGYGIVYTTAEDFFSGFRDNVCPHPVEKKRECFSQFMMRFSAYWEEVCEKGPKHNQTECDGAERAMMEGIKVIEEYTVAGKCYNGKEMAEKAAKDPSKIAGHKKEMKNVGETFGKGF